MDVKIKPMDFYGRWIVRVNKANYMKVNGAVRKNQWTLTVEAMDFEGKT